MGHILCCMVALQLIVGASIGHAQIKRFITGAVVLHAEGDADKSTCAGLRSLARNAGHFRFNSAILEVRRLDDRKNLFSSLYALALNVDDTHRAASVIA